MSVLEYIILSFALAIPMVVTVRGCAWKNPIRLTRGLGVSFLLATEQVLFILLGIYVANLLRFDMPEYDNLIYLGFLVLVAVRMFFPAFRKQDKELPAYNISRWGIVLLLGVATSINTLLVGLGLGFRIDLATDLWRLAIPLWIIMFLLSYWGIMLGRRHKEIRARRWQLFAVLFLLIFAIKGAFFGE
ncbi:MAG: manganese efflux pump [Bacteroidales bacterium]|nr:manganese efflux pump [Bacteroidales bacterium]